MDVFGELKQQLGSQAKLEEPMWRHTSFRVGGPAALFVRVHRPEELERLIPVVAGKGVSWRILGGATNVLVADTGVRECIIANLGERPELRIKHESVDGEGVRKVVVVVPTGVRLATLARRAVDEGLAGLEWAAGLPGTVGGAVVNNAGAHGSDVAAIFESAVAADSSGSVHQLTREEMDYSYRSSVFKEGGRPGMAILSVEFRLQRGIREELLQTAARFEEARRRSQPTGLTAGSVFKNPPGDYAGRLVEAAGLKGLAVGAARVSTLHGNFFVNSGGATAQDLYRLARLVQDTVWQEHGVWLEPEIELIGGWTEEQRHALKQPPAIGDQGSAISDQQSAISGQ